MTETNLSDGIVTLRALEPSDVDRLYVWENDPSVWRHGDRRAPLSRQQLWDYVNNYDADPVRAGQLRLMIADVDGEAVGTADLYELDAINRRAAVGIMVIPACRRRGYAVRALRLLARYCRDQIGLHQLWSVTADDNEASRRTFASAGYQIAGRLRSWTRSGGVYHDAYISQLMLQNVND